MEENCVKQLLQITFENSFRYHKCYYLFLSFGFTFSNPKLFCKKVWWYIFDFSTIYLIQKSTLSIKKLVGKKSTFSSKRRSFRMVFKLVIKTLFKYTYNFCDYLILFSFDIIKVYDDKVISFCYVFLILLHI